jgi:GT2 family glycosyltransferase
VAVDVVVVIVTYNSAHVVGAALDSLPDALAGLSADVVVVDNGSSDGTPDLVDQRDDCRLVRSANVGYAGGINRGVHESGESDAILALNPDVRLHAGSLAALMHTMRATGDAIIAPQIRAADGSVHHSLRREPSLGRTLGLTGTGLPMFAEYLNKPKEYLEPQVVDWALGAALLISRRCFEALAGFDESLFLYSEETDFCLRARDLGMRTRYEPAAVMTHIGGQSGQSGKTHSMQIINRVRVYRRRHGAAASWGFFSLTLLRELSWITRNDGRSRAAVRALLRPASRPRELNCSDRMMPS